MSTPRQRVFDAICAERIYQDRKWPQAPALPPSDELRLIRVLVAKADVAWYKTPDKIVNGAKVNPADMDAMRKIAAVAVRCMETYGIEERTDT